MAPLLLGDKLSSSIFDYFNDLEWQVNIAYYASGKGGKILGMDKSHRFKNEPFMGIGLFT